MLKKRHGEIPIKSFAKMNSDMNIIRIGVTGHRMLPRSLETRQAVRKVLKDISQSCLAGFPAGSRFEVISPLAEGADRIVADEVLCYENAALIVPLPFPVDHYLLDFNSEESRREFHQLLARASAVYTLHEQPPRPRAYFDAGRYVVDHCDILMALWDGVQKQNQGGTSDIVAYARRLNRPCILINTEDPDQIAWEHFGVIQQTQ